MSDEHNSSSLGDRLAKIIADAHRNKQDPKVPIKQESKIPVKRAWSFHHVLLGGGLCIFAVFAVVLGTREFWKLPEPDNANVITAKVEPQDKPPQAKKKEPQVNSSKKQQLSQQSPDKQDEYDLETARQIYLAIETARKQLDASQRRDKELESELQAARELIQKLEAEGKQFNAVGPKQLDATTVAKIGSMVPAFVEGSVIVAHDKQYLGRITKNTFDADSILNDFGKYGGKFSATSIFNDFGKYGGEFAQNSPFNAYTNTPPQIYTKSGTAVAYLTTNIVKTPRIDPYALIGYLKSK